KEAIDELGQALRSAGGHEAAVAAALKGRPGVVIGERHDQPDAWVYAYQNMHVFEENLVDTIYLEMLHHSDQRRLLDAYFDSRLDAPMSVELQRYLSGYEIANGLDKYPIRPRQVLEMAKRRGIRVVAIDSALARRVDPLAKERTAEINTHRM